MRTVITYGTFDIFHSGHVRLLKRARELGDRLVVGVSTDDFNHRKGKRSVFTYEERAEIVAAVRYVDDVFPENTWEQKRADILGVGATVFVMGDDWAGKFDDLRDIAEVHYVARTPSISTTHVKTSLRAFSSQQVEALRDAVEVMSTIVKGLAWTGPADPRLGRAPLIGRPESRREQA